MNTHVITSPRWTTTSDASGASSELSSLGAHFALCNGCQSRWFSLRCAAEAAHDFVARRMVTTVFVAGAAVALASLAL